MCAKIRDKRERFAVVDLETTGNFASGHRIVEVGIVLMDGTKKVDEYHTLIDPGRDVPGFITGLTGIRRAMLEEAPYFEDVADEIEELTRDRVFVAHNVNFDYSFMQREMELCGKPFDRRRLCTMRAARSVFSGVGSYGLKALCTHFDIEREHEHRALSDAQAAAEILRRALDGTQDSSRRAWLTAQTVQTALPSSVSQEEVANLPAHPGIYFFSNSRGQVIYIGKAKNLKNRVRSHFTATRNNVKKQRFIREVAQVEYRLSGTELIASLWEDHEIRSHQPILNSAQKDRVRRYGIYIYENRRGDARVAIQPKIASGSQPVRTFLSYTSAREWLMQRLIEEEISLEVAGWPHAGETVRQVDLSALFDALSEDGEPSGEFELLFDRGRSKEERAFIFRERGRYAGFGFFPGLDQPKTFTDIEPYLVRAGTSPLSESIVSRLWEEAAGQVIRLNHPVE